MSNSELVEFDLPVGATLGGCRHIGLGRFEALNPLVERDKSNVFGVNHAPALCEITNDGSQVADYFLDMKQKESSADKKMYRKVAIGRFRNNGEVVETESEVMKIIQDRQP